MEDMIEVTSIDLKELIKAAYKLSRPQGMGFVHFEEGELDKDSINKIIDKTNNDYCALSMDYVKGRAVKLTVFKEDGKLFIPNRWFDHSEEDLINLITMATTSKE